MPADLLIRDRERLEGTVRDPAAGFMDRYMAVFNLKAFSENYPERTAPETVEALETVLKETSFAGQRRGFFLFREAADALASVLARAPETGLGRQAHAALIDRLDLAGGEAHQAAAEALGRLPFPVCGPRMDAAAPAGVPAMSWHKLPALRGFACAGPPAFLGRSLLIPIDQKGKVLVLKMARPEDAPDALAAETRWMALLASGKYEYGDRFDIPEPLRVGDGFVFRVPDLPRNGSGGENLHPARYAVGYIARRSYFSYPNRADKGAPMAPRGFKDVMCKNAWLFGRLAAEGIIHSAPVPLFHNRIQRHRRRDLGLYEWFRGGRLDRWLASCDYPNFGPTGLRDFEHFTSIKRLDRNLYRAMGNHFLGLMLVAGSYFRNKDPERSGLDASGKPVDARDLFDPDLLAEILHGVFHQYYEGFAGEAYRETPPLDIPLLARRMIEEMGVDRYTEEIFRAADQARMDDAAFRRFLESQGFSGAEIAGFQKGERDIVIRSGPHLGGFNRRISLPEMIAAVEIMTALCIAGRFWRGVKTG